MFYWLSIRLRIFNKSINQSIQGSASSNILLYVVIACEDKIREKGDIFKRYLICLLHLNLQVINEIWIHQ